LGISNGGSVKPTTANVPPTADAGHNQQVQEGAVVRLDGTASTDSDGIITSYLWKQTAGPSVTLSSKAAQKPTFKAPSVSKDTKLTFSLVVSDNHGASSAPDTVNVLVNNVNDVSHTPTFEELIADVKKMHLLHGAERPLISSLKQAKPLLDDNNTHNDKADCGKLHAFTNKVSIMEKKDRLTSGRASELRQIAQEIESYLAC
jgi:hypothetical protein